MEALALLVLALVVLAVLSVENGSDSRSFDDVRHWWPGIRSDDAPYPQHHG